MAFAPCAREQVLGAPRCPPNQLFCVDFLFHNQIVLDVANQLLQSIDAAGTNVSANEHVHQRIAHFAAAFIEPGAYVVYAGPGESFGLSGG